MGKRIDLTGQRFGRLVVIERVENDRYGRTRWRCGCDCGNKTIVSSGDLVNGETKSCGCLRERLRSERSTKHGGSKTRLYRIWQNMKTRCYNPKSKYFARYGGRGVIVCDEWCQSFFAFREWALSHGYAEDLTIDRINNNEGYRPDNCRWVTQKKQVRNFSRNKLITYKGQTKPVVEWAEEKQISAKALYYRMQKGWTAAEALETPVGEQRKK